MADVVALRAALARLGFSAAAATYTTDDQGLDDLDEFRLLTDDEVENLCKVIRRPGGVVGGNPNHGIPVSLLAENNLKMACYFLRYQQRTSRVSTAPDITLVNVRALKDFKLWEEEHKDVDKPEINSRDWPKTIEALEEYFRGCLGVTKIPLAYVIRDDEAIPAVDPPGGYSSRQAELIARAPILQAAGAGYTQTFLSDRARVWELLSAITRDKDCWTYVRPAQTTRDGRAGFLRLKQHFLGQNNVDNMSNKAENTLKSTTYTGERRKWNFERFVRVHVDQHSILEGLVQHGYAGIDERSKVRHLLNGIKTTALDTVKTRIMSDAALRNDFDASVNLFQDFIKQTSTHDVQDVHIAALSQKTPSRKNSSSQKQPTRSNDVEPDMTVEDRYYKTSEYAKLSHAKKLGLKLIRAKRGHTPGTKSSKTQRNQGGVHLSKRTIKALAQAMAQDANSDMEESDDEAKEDDDEAPPAKRSKTNRNNKALSRKPV